MAREKDPIIDIIGLVGMPNEIKKTDNCYSFSYQVNTRM